MGAMLFNCSVVYDVVCYDSHWNELPAFRQSCVEWQEVYERLLTWTRANVDFMRSGDVVPVGASEVQFFSIEVRYVEKEINADQAPSVPKGRRKRSN